MCKSAKYVIGVSILSMFFFSCNRKDKEAEKIFIQIESLVEQNPDSALTLLKSIEFPEDLSPKNYANYLLLYIQSKDKSGKSIAEDTQIQIPVLFFLQKKDISKTALAYFYSGRVYRQRGEDEKAMQDLLSAKEYAEKSGSNNLSGLIHFDLGYMYDEDLNFKLALNHYRQSQEHFQKVGNEKNAVCILEAIGGIYLKQEPQQPELAFDNYNRVLQYAESLKDTGLIVSTLRSIGLTYEQTKDYRHAKEFLLQSIAADKHGKYSTGNYTILSRIYLALNMPDSAIYYAEQLSPKITGDEDSPTLYNYYNLMGEIYTSMSKYKQASECHQKKSDFLASFYDQKVKQSVLDVQEKYDSERLKSSLQKTELHRQFLLILALSGALVVVFLTGFIFIIIKKRKEKILQMEQNLETMKGMLKGYNENKLSLKQALLEELDIAKKIAQLHTVPTNTTEYNQTYFKIFGKNMAEKLDWNNNLYPVIDKLYDGFVEKLREKYPDLPEKDIQLCCLLRADFKIEEITFIQGYSDVTTTQTSKNRLRMKMGFPGMKEFLSSLKNM